MALLKLRQSSLPILGHWKVVKRLENYWKLLPCTTVHSSAPAASLVLSGPFLLNCLSQARIFSLGSLVTIHTWQLVPWRGLSVPWQVISWCFLAPSFCSMPGSCLELQFHSAVSKFCVCFFSSSLAQFLCLGTTYSFLPVAHTDSAPWPEPQARVSFCCTHLHLQRMCTKDSFPRIYKQKETGCFTPKSLHTPSLCGVCSSVWVSLWETGLFLGTQQPHPSQEDPGLKMVGGWKSIRSATYACLAPLFFHRTQLLAASWNTILGWDVTTLQSFCFLSEVHRQCIPHSQILFVCMHIAQESCKRYSSPDCWLSVDTEVSASQVSLRTLHAVCVLDSGFRCFGDD